MPWLQLRVDTDREHAEKIEEALLFAGAVSVTLQDNADQPILEPGLGEVPLWDHTRVTGLFDAEVDTAVTEAKAAAYLCELLPNARWEQLEDKDWEREWMSHYKPIRCGDKLWICPSWCEPPEPEAVNLLLDPGLAFGTGTHPTTFLCLQWLGQENLTGKNVIDFGCGSGILGIGAILLGAARASGTDIDPQALIASRDNAERNGIDPARFPVYLPEQLPREKADIVLANILAGPLVELAPQLSELTRIGGRICLSGILSSQADQVKAAYREWIDFDADGLHEDWVRLSGTRVR
ncbi:50S ribosomal protein L11 methyltransferase [Microbulbifer thermotolerans]|uniref:Ribosomal protein L11 methyltransferase n=1 Tax=Microbulbifer thermotolerans TaxID=252514 RepID=A0A143HJ80_MICTH|nr:50S ribosomal protein L11 methyltransferase [Microbulbifer thermotolerans]AMX01540.1 ribosomal protein L11 methyltransferase [Microbulbifer thermotolerans]MCX2778393.1 50S ribosomal protein L11 methyltransferase [Microbulbifer thermotolerans]MCX2784189.1 50S ribosomal protein L11 methyltransferase [Microbulbifer thermotolerans]MCX2804432.1 50S ribosomal protein L11 methyltransferase [Microbulbifer thermotolerans]MCX2834122.1 50S ribosomal protein L11 methyltransferase [Microbulbifer thermot